MENQDARVTVKQLRIGILVIGGLMMIIGGTISYVSTGKCISFLLGMVLGGVIAEALVTHMAKTLESAMLRDSDDATKYVRKMSILRYVIMCAAVLLALSFPSVFNVIGVLLGILALKFSAYAQPLTSKYIN